MIDRETYRRIYSNAYQDGRREGAAEMRGRAILAARDCLGVEVRADGVALGLLVTEAIGALSLIPEKPVTSTPRQS